MSRAAGQSLAQLGKKTSAGQLWVPGIRDKTSHREARVAVWAAKKCANKSHVAHLVVSMETKCSGRGLRLGKFT